MHCFLAHICARTFRDLHFAPFATFLSHLLRYIFCIFCFSFIAPSAHPLALSALHLLLLIASFAWHFQSFLSHLLRIPLLLRQCSFMAVFRSSRCCQLVTSSLTWFQVSSAPSGTQAATLDIEAAYRTIPVWPAHKRFLVVSFEGFFWIDHTFPFGLTTAGGVQGHVADATVDILAKLDVSPIKKWVDDHSIFRFPTGGGVLLPDGSTTPYQYLFGLIEVYDKSRPLGVPWHPRKWTDFSFIFVYLGFLWNLTERSVTLPESKRLKYFNKVSDVLLSLKTSSGRPGKLSCADAMSINGTLSHVSFVIPHGRTYLANLSHFIAGFPEHAHHASHHPAPSLVSDLEWWHSILSALPPPRHLISRGPPQDVDLWVDASTSWGVGLVFRDKWSAWTLVDGWKGNGRDIGWLEAVAVELAILTLFNAGQTHTFFFSTCFLFLQDGAIALSSFIQITKALSDHSDADGVEIFKSICASEDPRLSRCSPTSHILYCTQIQLRTEQTRFHAAKSGPLVRVYHTSSSQWSCRASFLLMFSATTSSSGSSDAVSDLFRFRSALVQRSGIGASHSSVHKISKPRKPKTGCTVSPSIFRPHVLARDRIRLWFAPHSDSFHQSLLDELSSDSASQLLDVLLASVEAKTRENYGSGLLRFHQFCDSLSISEEKRLPASEILLAAFVAHWAGRVAVTTVDNWLAGLHFWHQFNNAPWHGSSLLRRSKTGLSKSVPDSSKRPRRPPVTIEHMHALFQHLDLSNSFDSAVYCTACVAFWCCCRYFSLDVLFLLFLISLQARRARYPFH